MPTDAETEARVSGTAFFKLIGDRYYYLRHDARSNRWEVRVTPLPGRGAERSDESRNLAGLRSLAHETSRRSTEPAARNRR